MNKVAGLLTQYRLVTVTGPAEWARRGSPARCSVRTVRTHLDQIRDKSGCRRRADLTRLALQEGII